MEKSVLLPALQSIEGMMQNGEVQLLFDIASTLPASALAIEIGSWLGKSSIAIASAIKPLKGTLHCIDDHSGITLGNEADHLEKTRLNYDKNHLKETFLNNLRKHGVCEYVVHHDVSSVDFVPSLPMAADFLFIDGDHTYSAVKQDMKKFIPMVKPNGWILFHDARHDVATAIQEWFKDSSPPIACVKMRGSLLALKLSATTGTSLSSTQLKKLLSAFPYCSIEIPPNKHFISKWTTKIKQSRARKAMRQLEAKTCVPELTTAS